MKKRIIAPIIVIISLLTGCHKSIELRSDIKQFIASFSVNEARKIYLDAGYTRIDVSNEAQGEVMVMQSLNFNIKDLDAITYDRTYKKQINGETVYDYHRYTTLDDGVYTLHKIVDGEEETNVVTAQNIIQIYVTPFFYTNEIEEVHSMGMYVGDTLKEILPEIQQYVTIDFDEETLTYDIPWGAKKDVEGYDFEEVLVVDKLGITNYCYIHQTNGIVDMTTNIAVYNNQ